jgi:hypothetical protein
MRSARDKAKLKALRSSLDTAAETIQGEFANDEPLREGLWDCLDYIDYRL